MTYKVLVADDEELIRQGVAKLLSKDPEIEVIAQAEDGKIALELALQLRPDILLVDINMPVLNGLEFIERLANHLPDAVVVVITGYDDFVYIQQAIKLEVFDYVLKPVMEQAFFDCIGRAKEKFAQNQKQQKYFSWAKLQLERNRPVMLSDFLNDWLEGRLSEPEIEEQIQYLNLSVPENAGVTIVHMTVVENEISVGEEWSEELLYYAAYNMATELFVGLEPVTAFKNKSGDLILLSGCVPENDFRDAGMALKAAVERHLPVKVLFAQERAQSLVEISRVYDDAREQLQKRGVYSQLIAAAMQAIEDGYSDSALSLQSTAQALHVSPQYLSRTFRHETGMTFMDYVIKVRIRRAVELLSVDDLRIYEVADKVGYATQQYFSNAFKKVLGVSPLEYRKNDK